MRNASEMSHLDLDDDVSGLHVLCSRVRVDRTAVQLHGLHNDPMDSVPKWPSGQEGERW